MAIGNPLASGVWWKAALIRALRTAILVAIPYVPASYFGAVPYLTLASSAGLGFILSILTSLVDLPEADGKAQPWWFAVLSRVVKTVAQAILSAIGNALLIQNVHWSLILQVTIASAFGSLLLAVLTDLPETATPSLPGGQYVNNLVPPAPAPAPVVSPPVQPAIQTPAQVAAAVAAGTE